jgi:hypothetical protein
MIDVNEYIHKALKEKGVGHKFKHRMSSAGRCVRARYYHGAGVPVSDEREWRSLLALARGQDMEDLALDLLRAGGAPIHSEQLELTSVHPVVGPITGHPDALWGDDGGLDVKGTNASGWGWIKTHGPHRDNVDQCLMYMGATGRKWWVLLYVNRDGYPRDEFPFQPHVVLWDHEAYQDALARFVAVKLAMDAGEAPPRPFAKPKEFPCSFCDWGKHCWGEYVEAYKDRTDEEVEIGDSHLEAVGVQYRILQDDAKEIEKKLKPLRAEIGVAMEAARAKKARAGVAHFSCYTVERASRDFSLLDEETLKAITTTSTSEQLRVKVDEE